MIALESFYLVLKFYKFNIFKTISWFYTENPLLGNIKPITLLRYGRKYTLNCWIKYQLEENKNENTNSL